MSLPQRKVVLFGRTGDGKSAVANALVTGGVQPVVFPSTDGARGCTAEIKTGSGRGWTVTDTVGLGERETGSISRDGATELLTKFLKRVKDSYSHIIFVQRAERLTEVDTMNWLLFCEIFEGAEEAFVILFTGVDQQWVDCQRDMLPFGAGIKTLAVDIPPISKKPELERKLAEIRAESIRELEENLIEFFAQRGNQYSVPRIAQMNDAQLEKKSTSTIQFIVSAIKRMFDPDMWLKIASKLSSLVDLAKYVQEKRRT